MEKNGQLENTQKQVCDFYGWLKIRKLSLWFTLSDSWFLVYSGAGGGGGDEEQHRQGPGAGQQAQWPGLQANWDLI